MTVLTKIGGWTPRCGAETWVPVGEWLVVRQGSRVGMPPWGQPVDSVCQITVLHSDGTTEFAEFRRES